MPDQLDDRGKPIGPPVTVTSVDLSFADVFFLVLMVTVSQAIIIGIAAAAFAIWHFSLI